ncbi:MAG: glutathione S-transferase family protein [Prochlorotrichaceae cyanobacterium]
MFKKASLPPGILIQLAQTLWHGGWSVMMGQMAPRNPAGEYIRPASEFRQRVGEDPKSPFPADFQRYGLIVGWSCPWAHRTLMVRALKGLTDCLPVTIVSPSPQTGGWSFESPFQDCSTLREFYQRAQPGYQGRSTVPVLWDQQTGTIVNNESAEIIEILNTAFSAWEKPDAPDLYPEGLRETIDRWNEKIYETVNNGVYRCGFAQNQSAYETACYALFETLDEVEAVLGQQPFLCGASITLADVRLFTTLIRFEVYATLFKCSLKPIAAYPHLQAYRQRIYHYPGIAETCNLQAVKQDYYGNLFPLNPGGIIPLGNVAGFS